MSHSFSFSRSECLDSINQQTEQQQFESDNSEKLFFAYLSRSYRMFLAGEDNFAALEAELAQIFGSFLTLSFVCLFVCLLVCLPRTKD